MNIKDAILEPLAITVFMGKVFTSITKINNDTDGKTEYLVFEEEDGSKFIMGHLEASCCEYSYLEDMCGDFADIMNSPILLAERATNENLKAEQEWNFYKLSTIKGSVTLRWDGDDNMGYYSIAVNIYKMK